MPGCGALDRAGRLTPGGLRTAIARAVMEVAPKKAKKRREVAAKFARVERWAEDSGNAALAGRELPPAEVLAVDQRITWWAGELRKAGLEGGMDVIRARALLDLLLGMDSRPRQDGAAAPAARLVSGGFAGRVTLTQVRHATCTEPGCRRPAATCDFEHNTPYDAGGRTCLCNGGPLCKR